MIEMEQNPRDMVFSSFVADSLALGAHWIYDTELIKSTFGRVDRLLQPIEGSFHPQKKAGEFTHYGDQTLCLLEFISESSGFDPGRFSRAWSEFMETYRGYMDHATLETIDNINRGGNPESSGSDSTDLGGASRISPILFLYRKNADMAAAASKAQTALTHKNPAVLDAAEYFARVTLKSLGGASPVSALQQIATDHYRDTQIQKWVRWGIGTASADTKETVLRFGQMCDINAAFPSVIHIIAKYENNLKDALIENVMAGGDSAARGMIVGMVLGSFHGIGSLPEQWIRGMKTSDRINVGAVSLEDDVNEAIDELTKDLTAYGYLATVCSVSWHAPPAR